MIVIVYAVYICFGAEVKRMKRWSIGIYICWVYNSHELIVPQLISKKLEVKGMGVK